MIGVIHQDNYLRINAYFSEVFAKDAAEQAESSGGVFTVADYLHRMTVRAIDTHARLVSEGSKVDLDTVARAFRKAEFPIHRTYEFAEKIAEKTGLSARHILEAGLYYPNILWARNADKISQKSELLTEIAAEFGEAITPSEAIAKYPLALRREEQRLEACLTLARCERTASSVMSLVNLTSSELRGKLTKHGHARLVRPSMRRRPRSTAKQTRPSPP